MSLHVWLLTGVWEVETPIMYDFNHPSLKSYLNRFPATHDGVSAAQSGSVTGNQTSTLSVTVNGPGTLTFYWSSIANDPNEGFDYEFDIDGSYANDIYGDQSWTQGMAPTQLARARTR